MMRLVSAVLTMISVSAADWNLEKAMAYLDARQQAWESFKPAKKAHGTCISCHTGLGYLLLRETGSGKAPAAMETNLYASLRGRLGEPPAKGVGASVESVLAAVVLAKEKDGDAALERMFGFQVREGESRGAFPWYSLQLDPWESADSQYFGAALAAVAVSRAPRAYRDRSETKALMDYLERTSVGQPLHNRLTLLWTGKKLISPGLRKTVVEQVWAGQAADGSWNLTSLGPWAKAPRDAAVKGNDAYATGLAIYSLRMAGVARTDPRLQRAMGWLAARQDAASGAWPAASMNKEYDVNSMMIHFMTDAATAYAVLAMRD